MVKIEECDLICPSHYIDWNYFSSNLMSWLEEIPVRKIFIGNNNPDESFRSKLKDYLGKKDKRIEFIDQYKLGYKTLGMQIADLMKRVETEFFIYCHADAWPCKNSFFILEHEMKDNIGMIESERVQYDYEGKYNYPTVYPYYHYRERAFSGYQLIRMKAIENILDKIEDDYIYRNEDIIFQNVCTQNGYKYLKSWAMHIHTCSNDTNHKWTPKGKFTTEEECKAITFDMQIRGIVKYCTPDDITKVAWRDAFGVAIQLCNANIFDFLDNFVGNKYPEWRKAIIEIANDRIAWGYR